MKNNLLDKLEKKHAFSSVNVPITIVFLVAIINIVMGISCSITIAKNIPIYVEAQELVGTLSIPVNNDGIRIVSKDNQDYIIPAELINVHANNGEKVAVYVDKDGVPISTELHKFNDEFFENNQRVERPLNAKAGTISEILVNKTRIVGLLDRRTTYFVLGGMFLGIGIILFALNAPHKKSKEK